jgi:hypothetical protein
MKRFFVAATASVLTCTLCMGLVLIKLITLGNEPFHDTISLAGIAIAQIDNDPSGFAIETKYGLALFSLLIGIVVFIIMNLRNNRNPITVR